LLKSNAQVKGKNQKSANAEGIYSRVKERLLALGI